LPLEHHLSVATTIATFSELPGGEHGTLFAGLRDGTKIIAQTLEELRGDLEDVRAEDIEVVAITLGEENESARVEVIAYVGRFRGGTILSVSGTDDTKVYGLHTKVRNLIDRSLQDLPSLRRRVWHARLPPLVDSLVAPLVITVIGAVIAGIILAVLHFA
jgi:hypothetical protein